MDDYINKKEALAFPLSYDHYDRKNGDIKFIHGVESYRDYIEGLTSVDAVEVVRCRDCINYGMKCCQKDKYFVSVKEDDFCSNGVKKNEVN